MRSASRTAADAIDTVLAPMSVSERTALATEKVRWNSLFSSKPSVPADSAARTAVLNWPRICASPSTIESSPLATRKACLTARSCGSWYRCGSRFCVFSWWNSASQCIACFGSSV